MKRCLTRSEKYFVDRFNSATLNGAIERAACEERGANERCSRPPIDIFEIAKARRIEIKEDLVGEYCGEGLLLPSRSGYIVRLRASSTKSRKRFSLAHELGHTLFYKDEGKGPRHQIGVLDRSEKSAEERICNAFASALLMPPELVRQKIVDLPTAEPSTALCKLDSTARFFGVSVLALLHRLRAIQLHVPPYMLLCMSERPNPATGKDATLRIDAAVPIGTWRDMYVWRNRSAHNVGLLRATTLYGEWAAVYGSAPARGSFGIDPNTGSVATNCIFSDSEESLLLSRVVHGRWRNEPVRVFSSQRLYAWTDASEGTPYIVAAIALAHSPGKVPTKQSSI
jgi:Zn-dependent peptidase ImmA (M78 family)